MNKANPAKDNEEKAFINLTKSHHKIKLMTNVKDTAKKT